METEAASQAGSQFGKEEEAIEVLDAGEKVADSKRREQLECY